MLLFPPTGEDKKLYIYSHSYLPKSGLERHIRSDRAPYDWYVQGGYLTLTASAIILDYKYIIEDLKKLVKDNNLHVKLLCYDPMGASGIIADLQEICPELVEVGQYPKALNDATRHCQQTIIEGGVEYDKGNELLTRSVVNAQAVLDSKKQMIVDKREDTNRIDPVDALIDAWAGWLTIKPNDNSAETWLSLMGNL